MNYGRSHSELPRARAETATIAVAMVDIPPGDRCDPDTGFQRSLCPDCSWDFSTLAFVKI
jgi:hypothetical protein